MVVYDETIEGMKGVERGRLERRGTQGSRLREGAHLDELLLNLGGDAWSCC